MTFRNYYRSLDLHLKCDEITGVIKVIILLNMSLIYAEKISFIIQCAPQKGYPSKSSASARCSNLNFFPKQPMICVKRCSWEFSHALQIASTLPHLINIRNWWFTPSVQLKAKVGTRNRSESCKCKHALNYVYGSLIASMVCLKRCSWKFLHGLQVASTPH
jgi:hypothetical protein